jgi:hypothetical protein
MRRSIPHGCVARRLNDLLFALLTPCHVGASTRENANLFLGEPVLRNILGSSRINVIFPSFENQHFIYL